MLRMTVVSEYYGVFCWVFAEQARLRNNRAFLNANALAFCCSITGTAVLGGRSRELGGGGGGGLDRKKHEEAKRRQTLFGQKV